MHSHRDYVTAITNFVTEHDHIPSPDDIRNTPDTPPIRMFLAYYGTWNNAIRNAGYTPEKTLHRTASTTHSRLIP